MAYKFYHEKNLTDLSVSYQTLNEDDKLIYDYHQQGCFSALSYGTIPSEVKKVVVIRRLRCIPYVIEIVRKWVEEISGLGFPCTLMETKQHGEQTCNFVVDLAQYKWKAHFISTLMLIRALYETGIACTPERYFTLLEEKPDGDKFEMLQNAHRTISKCKDGVYYNTNHMITYSGNGNNVSFDELLKNFTNTARAIYQSHNYSMYRLWSK